MQTYRISLSSNGGFSSAVVVPCTRDLTVTSFNSATPQKCEHNQTDAVKDGPKSHLRVRESATTCVQFARLHTHTHRVHLVSAGGPTQDCVVQNNKTDFYSD